MNQSKKSRLFIIVLLAITIIAPAIPQVQADGYGEDSDSLGQFVDDYENDDNVSVAVNIINNQTLDCMELNYSSEASKIYENFTEYTEVDIVADRIQMTAVHIDHKAYRNEITYLYYDKGADYFTDFEHQFQARSALDETLSMGIIWMLSNVLGDGMALINSADDYIAVNFIMGSSYPQITLRECDSGVTYATSVDNPVANTWYYFTVKKIGLDLICEIYTNSIRTTLFSNLTLTLHNDYLFRYIYGCNTFNIPSANYHNNDIEYLWIGDWLGGYETTGYFTTEDYLNYTTGQSLALLTNISLPGSTSITAEFSEDNSTWVDNEGNAGGNTLVAGFYALDLRDLNYTDLFTRYNFTGPGDSTPRLYQSRLITTEGPPGDGEPVDDYSIIFLAIGLIMMLCIAFLYVRDR